VQVGVGSGQVVALADASILHNRHLDDADNAALAVSLVGQGRAVVFDEASHGYGAGASGLPGRWVRFLIAATLAVLVWMWTEAKRLGPPEDVARPLPPARREYVDALAVSLSRTRDPLALTELQRSARRRLATRLGLPPDASRSETAAAAARAGITEHDVALLFEHLEHADVVELGRVAARYGGGRL
jgi:hypothetical protein